jgi:hypothetical protein
MSAKCRAYSQYSKNFRSFDTSEHIRTLLNNAMKKAFHAGWDAARKHANFKYIAPIEWSDDIGDTCAK